MKIKPIGVQLDVNECEQLLNVVADNHVAEIRRDEKNSDNLIVYVRNMFNEGYQSMPIADCAKMLSRDMTGQTYIRNRLKEKGIELVEFEELNIAAL